MLQLASWPDFAVFAKAVATGVGEHEGGHLGSVGLWLNTLFSGALAWLSVTGLMAWWRRKPAQTLTTPAKRPWPTWLRATALAPVPLLGLSAALLWLGERVWNRAPCFVNN